MCAYKIILLDLWNEMQGIEKINFTNPYFVVSSDGLEPSTASLKGRCSTNWATSPQSTIVNTIFFQKCKHKESHTCKNKRWYLWINFFCFHNFFTLFLYVCKKVYKLALLICACIFCTQNSTQKPLHKHRTLKFNRLLVLLNQQKTWCAVY